MRGLFLNLALPGHLNPTLGIVRELVRSGHSIDYFSSTDAKTAIENHGARFIALPQIVTDAVQGYDPSNADNWDLEKGLRLTLIELALILTQWREQIIKAVLGSVETEAYDYIVHDAMHGAGYEIGQVLKLPRVCSCPHFISDNKHNSDHSFWSVKEKLKSIFKNPQKALRLWKLRREIQFKYNIKVCPINDYFYDHGDLNIIHTSKEFHPPIMHQNTNLVFTGPSLDREEQLSEFPFNQLSNHKVVYVSAGTLIKPRKLFESCIGAFKDSDFVLVLAVGSNRMVNELGNVPSNIIVFDRVPQLELLKFASVFITHAGMNSVNEGLYFGVPLLTVPYINDAFINSERVCALGAGLSLDYKSLSPENIRAKVEELVHKPSYAENAKRIGESFKKAGGSKRAAQIIIDYVSKN